MCALTNHNWYYNDYSDGEARLSASGRSPGDSFLKCVHSLLEKAEFAYNTLASRIEKKDLVDPNYTRRYYYNYNWQVLAEYDGSDTLQRTFIYGNYIDEVLLMKVDANDYYYIHDHLYSAAVLANSSGTVLERYEYDAYGNPTIWNADFTTERDSSNYGNPYLFTGRRVDILDSGSLKIQYNRNRYYDYYTGRWLTHDPLGITPNVRKPNVFEIITQYEGGLNLYYALDGNPVTQTDMYGLKSCEICGPDVTSELTSVIDTVVGDYIGCWDDSMRERHCDALYDTSTRGTAWEIEQLHGRSWIEKQFPCCATKPQCKGTVEVSGKCYHASDVNYLLWGVMNELCGNWWVTTELAIHAHKHFGRGHSPNPETIAWARLGFLYLADWSSHPLPASRHKHCKHCDITESGGDGVPFFTYIWREDTGGIDWL